MAGVIKKLYHPTDNGTVTTAVSQELQEVYPITATSAVYAPAEAPSDIRGKNLEQILNLKQNLLVSGQNIKTINNISLLGEGNITIEGGGGGGGGSILDQYLGFDAEKGAVYVKNNYGFYSNSFISAGGVGDGGTPTPGGDGNATSIMGYPIIIDSTHPLNDNAMLMYNIVNHTWEPIHPYRPVDIKKSTTSVIHVLDGYSMGTLFLQEGTGITLEKDSNNANSIIISATGGGGSPYTLPIASSSQLGGIKVGSGLSINSSTGVLSCDLSNYVTNSSLSSTLSGYVDKTSTQNDITGFKTFQSGIGIGNSSKTITLVNGEFVINGNVRVNGNFYASGNVTAGSS